MTLLTLNPIKTVLDQLDRLAAWGWDIPLRLFLAWEFFESGLEKWHGDNWFEQIHASFPFPFNHFSAGFDWQVSMWAELIAPILLLLGVATRFVSGYLYDPALDSAEAAPSSDVVGAGSTHAWLQAYLPGAGWVPFDPTNNLLGGNTLIRVGVTRDPQQAAPVAGTWFGPADAYLGMEVGVQVTRQRGAD